MSSMHTPQSAVQPFAVVRKGFDREQVDAALTRLEAEAELLRADRDSAVERADRATTELERERDRVRALEARVAELGRAPATSEQMSDRLSTMLELATAEAASIRDAAHSAAAQVLAEAEEDAWRLRESAGAELKEVRARNTAVRAEHDSALRAARSKGEEIIRSAEREARLLDDVAAEQRHQIDEDHRLASDLRRREALRAEQSRQAATEAATRQLHAEARQSADEIIAEAHDSAGTMINEAVTYTEHLREVRRYVMSDLAFVRARLESVPASPDDDDPLPAPPDFSSSDE